MSNTKPWGPPWNASPSSKAAITSRLSFLRKRRNQHILTEWQLLGEPKNSTTALRVANRPTNSFQQLENPSPSQILRCFLHPTFSLPSNRHPNSNQTVTLNLNSCKTPNPPQLPPSAAVIENSFMATMMRPSVLTWSSSSSSPGTKIWIIWSVNREKVERKIILAAVEVRRISRRELEVWFAS